MANGRKTHEPGYCEYQYSDKTYCKEQIVKKYTDSNGLDICIKWDDEEKNDYCMFHSHNEEKAKIYHEVIESIIRDKGKSLVDKLSEKQDGLLSNEERKKREEIIRLEFKIDFEGYYFPGNFIHGDKNFTCQITFEDATFARVADFKRAIFEDNVCFDGVKFLGLNDFSYAVFKGEASFVTAIFESSFQAYFSVFEKKAKFHWATFNNGLNFWKASFIGPVSFFNVVIFNNIKNKNNIDKVSFADVIFNNTADFSGSSFLGNILDFSRTVINENGTIFNNTVFNCEVNFHEQMLKGVRFTGCYLGSASFYGSDVRDAVFINSSWNRRFLEKQIERLKKDKRIEKDISVLEISRIITSSNQRAVLLDEYIYKYSQNNNTLKEKWIYVSFGIFLSMRGIKNYLRNILKKQRQVTLPCYSLEPSKLELDPLYLEHLYCQFKLAMDRNKMYSLANDFYYGERLMEMKRLWQERSFWSILKSTFLWFYQRLAGFGNSPWRAIISLILILFTSSGLLIKYDGLTALNIKEANERCPCERNEIKPAAVNKQNLKTPATPAKASKSYISMLVYNSLAPLDAFNQSVKQPQSARAPVKVPQKKEAVYSLKGNYWCNVFHVSLWNLTASPGKRSGDYKENGIWAYIAVFFIQYVFRPLMVALIIISVRRKVYRG